METKTKELLQLEADLYKVIQEKDDFVERSRQMAKELTEQIEAIRAKYKVEQTLAEMGEPEKEALRKALGDT